MKIIKNSLFMSIFLALSVSAQTETAIERELVGLMKDIDKWSAYSEGYDQDKLDSANRLLETTLLKYTKRPATLKYKFPELDKHLYIATSDDGKFRVYSWDTQSGGTMHFYRRVYQYMSVNGQVFSKAETNDEGDPSGFVFDVFTLDTTSGKVYLVCSATILSSADNYQNVSLFKISGNSLNENVKLIKTKTGLKNSLNFGYDFSSVSEREERPVKLILYDKIAKSIKIPVVIKDETTYPYGKVTDRFITYKFNGTYFVKVD